MKKLLIIIVFLACTGCDSFTWKSNPGNSTTSMSTPYGAVNIKMAEDLTVQEQILLSQAITVSNLTQVEIVQQQAIDNAGKRRANIIVMVVLSVWVVLGCLTLVVCTMILKGAK